MSSSAMMIGLTIDELRPAAEGGADGLEVVDLGVASVAMPNACLERLLSAVC